MTGASVFKGVEADLLLTGEMSHVCIPLSRNRDQADRRSTNSSPQSRPAKPSSSAITPTPNDRIFHKSFNHGSRRS